MSSQDFDEVGGAADEVGRYAAEVRAELADLAPVDSAELLEDLEDHLREVAAEGAGDLRARLGSPAAYAQELRESAGLPPRQGIGASAGTGTNSRAKSRAGRPPRPSLGERVADAEIRFRATPFGAETMDFLPTLRPAWWVLRAWLLVRLLEALTNDGGDFRTLSVIPAVSGSRAFGFVLLVAAVIGSVWLARHRTLTGRTRSALLVGQTLLVLFAALVATKSGGYESVDPSQVAFAQPQGLTQDGRQISNLYVYDKSGKLLDGVFVYDQDGNPVDAEGSRGSVFSRPGWQSSGMAVTNLYPLPMWMQAVETPQGLRPRAIPAPTTQAVPQNLQKLFYNGDDPTVVPDPVAPPTTPTAPSASP